MIYKKIIITLFLILLISGNSIAVNNKNNEKIQIFSSNNIRINDLDINFTVLTDKPSYKWIFEPVKITMEIKNNNQENFALLRFPTTQLYDIIIENSNGRKIYQWSELMSFNQVITEILIFPGETAFWNLNWNQRGHYFRFMPMHLVLPGEYNINAILPLIDEEYHSESNIEIDFF